MLVFSRSGHGFKYDISLSNSVGVIDSDYRQEVRVKLRADSTAGQGILDNLKAGDRIAQAMLLPVSKVSLQVVETLSVPNSDRKGGFGSTGM
ncbi:MAG: deoxyuridine 5'-triphosphate nucleotidohydrolase [Siphoviridae sp. ctdc_1]|nr:MAG: deoxyuridine 5'-triphosphate nucleotidohydrolase [Siphoviridae sp. ctdc_1]